MEPNNPLDQFAFLSVIGKGSYAKVILVRKKTNQKLYALKSMKKKYIQKKKHEDKIMLQKQVLTQINHPFLVKLSSSFQDQKKLYLVLQYCPGGQLFALLTKKKRFTQQQTKFYAAQIIMALQYLHQKGIIYRDLKPENVLIDSQGYIKLTDFGLSKNNVCGDQDLFSVCGTPQYLAPQIIKKEGHGKAVDWWCLGSIIYEMLHGLPPFYTKNRNQLYDRIKNSQPYYNKQWSKNVRDLLALLFTKDPKIRINKIDKIKQHPWFSSINFEKLQNKQIKAPFIPIIKNEIDVSNFDREFTQQEVQSCCSSFSQGKTLDGFSFQKSPIMGGKSIEQTNMDQFTLDQQSNKILSNVNEQSQ